LSGTI